jgi:hypothetical protein
MNGLPHPAFRARRSAAALNIVAVGTALAACTAAAFRMMWSHDVVPYAAISTFVMGTIWAAAVRATGRKAGIRIGWLMSPVLACMNAMVCVGLMLLGEGRPTSFLSIGLVVIGGGLIGAIIWIPALVLTMLFFGLPIAHAQRLASRGLAGVDRGEIIVGLVSAVLSLVVFVASPPSIDMVLALAAIACGMTAAVVATMRERARRAFVRQVEAGAVAHFRVDPSAHGKVLVRVTSNGMAYRVSDFVEEVAKLGEGDEVISAASL